MKFPLWLWCSFYLSLRYFGQKIQIFYLLLCILNPCIFKIKLQLKLVGAGQAFFCIFSSCWIYFHNILKWCGLKWTSLCSFVCENFATFCTNIERFFVLSKFNRGLNVGTNQFKGCGSPAGSHGGDEREIVGQYVEAGSPAEVKYYRWWSDSNSGTRSLYATWKSPRKQKDTN